MAELTAEGNVKLHWLPTVAAIAAPTTTEITAGTDLTPQAPTSGVSIDFTQNNASLPKLDQGKISKAVGTEEASISLTFTRDSVDADDIAWELFSRNLQGYLLVSRFGAPVADSRVEVYQVESHRPVMLPPAQDEYQQMRVNLAPADWDTEAVVASAA